MRVVLVMTGGGGGGLQQSIVPYAAALLRAGHEVLAIILKGTPFEHELRALGIQVVVTRWPRKPLPFAWMQAQTIRRAATDFGAEIAIGFASKGLTPAQIAFQGRMPVLTRCGATRSSTVRKLLNADGVIATSDEMRAIILDMGMPADRVHLLPNFLTGDARDHSDTAGSVPTVGGLGRLVPRKGFDLLVGACGILRSRGLDHRLVIGGKGAQATRLAQQARNLGVEASFPGWIDNARKPAFFDDIDVFVCPSRDEPFGFIYLEAMQAGVPVVTTDTVGARFIFTAGTDALLVPQDDAEAMADAIARLLEDPSLRRRLATTARRSFLERFQIDAAASTLDKILTTGLAMGPRA